ncbi:MAG: methyltransferase domain-containing protein [Acidimicrobiia bacterium]|nr:methyltransferase domain-containing protein [Acidimicrobiia bacterium]
MTALGSLVEELLGPDIPVRFEAYDGTSLGPPDAAATVVLRNEDALRYILRAPGELGFARAYVTGSLDVEGDLWEAFELRRRFPQAKLSPHLVARLARVLGPAALREAPPIPPEEINLGSPLRRHTRDRDRAAIGHHYDMGNDFYELVLGPSMTYSCAVFESPEDSLERAQANKYELICRKLGIGPGDRLLDVGCGWGGMVRHAARHHGASAVGITISAEQAAYARRRAAEEGLGDRVEIRFQDYRDLDEGQFDAVSSIGMFEHVGLAHLEEYFAKLHKLLRPGGRLLNHQIGRPPAVQAGHRHHRYRQLRASRPAMAPRGFLNRYVFPDGELHEVGTVLSAMQRHGFEVRHLESLREHYALTLRRWVANLEAGWDQAVAATSEGRARVWRLYMVGAALMFERGATQVHQVLGVATPRAIGADEGRSGLGLRPQWEEVPLGDVGQAGHVGQAGEASLVPHG